MSSFTDVIAAAAAAAPPTGDATAARRQLALVYMRLPTDNRRYILEEDRDEIFRRLRKDNRSCFDCNTRNPTWLSLSYSIFLCLTCSGKHRRLGTHLSFVRSSEMDKFAPEQLLRMELGGNRKAHEFFREHGVDLSRSIDYHGKLAAKYRTHLDRLVQHEMQGVGWIVPSQDQSSNLTTVPQNRVQSRPHDQSYAMQSLQQARGLPQEVSSAQQYQEQHYGLSQKCSLDRAQVDCARQHTHGYSADQNYDVQQQNCGADPLSHSDQQFFETQQQREHHGAGVKSCNATTVATAPQCIVATPVESSGHVASGIQQLDPISGRTALPSSKNQNFFRPEGASQLPSNVPTYSSIVRPRGLKAKKLEVDFDFEKEAELANAQQQLGKQTIGTCATEGRPMASNNTFASSVSGGNSGRITGCASSVKSCVYGSGDVSQMSARENTCTGNGVRTGGGRENRDYGAGKTGDTTRFAGAKSISSAQVFDAEDGSRPVAVVPVDSSRQSIGSDEVFGRDTRRPLSLEERGAIHFDSLRSHAQQGWSTLTQASSDAVSRAREWLAGS